MRRRAAAPVVSGTVDVLSDVLRNVRLTGALFFPMETSSPWVDEVPRAAKFASIVLPGAQHVVSYHIVRQDDAGPRFAAKRTPSGPWMCDSVRLQRWWVRVIFLCGLSSELRLSRWASRWQQFKCSSRQ